MNIASIDVQTIQADWLSHRKISLDLLRLDKIHAVLSGNKWFKLKYYLQDAVAQHKDTIATFGGAWSNHIVAVACVCHEAGLKCRGIIRGERPETFSKTLSTAVAFGMDLCFVSRSDYDNKQAIAETYKAENWYWINEGGCGEHGVKGATEILQLVDTASYTHIVAAAGTGTMLAGLLRAAHDDQKVIGISSMKGNFSLHQQIVKLAAREDTLASMQIMHDYHFGGYAKHPPALINFMNSVYLQHQLPLDIVYTAKTFFAIQALTEKNFFESQSRLLMIHSGGLQGNSSLAPEVLVF